MKNNTLDYKICKCLSVRIAFPYGYENGAHCADCGAKLKNKKKNKYKAQAVIIDGYRFDSKKEAAFYDSLRIKKASGEIKYFLRQVPFHLSEKVTYRCDFAIIDNDDRISYWEVKGVMTNSARTKLAWTEKMFDIHINIV